VITAYLVGDEQVLAWLRAAPEAVNSGLARAITKLGIDLQRQVQENQLTGQVLAIRSGSLKSSIDLRFDQSANGVTATVFSDSRYAGAHEFGFAGTADVRASLRNIKQAFGRPIPEKSINVRAYSRRMDLPERSFLRTALEDMAPIIRDEVDTAVGEALTP
jgi:phage gpG-like protein